MLIIITDFFIRVRYPCRSCWCLYHHDSPCCNDAVVLVTMSSKPLHPSQLPRQSRSRQTSSLQQPLPPQSTGASSASSSSTASPQSIRADQVIYRVYVKTVEVLVEGRLTHYGNGSKGGERKKDKWVSLLVIPSSMHIPRVSEKLFQAFEAISLTETQFNISLPEVELHKSDLQIYRSVSAYPQLSPQPDSDTCSIPPLLVAFILDTSDLPSGQALIWNRHGGKATIDTGLMGAGAGKGKEKETRTGIVVERWTLRAR